MSQQKIEDLIQKAQEYLSKYHSCVGKLIDEVEALLSQDIKKGRFTFTYKSKEQLFDSQMLSIKDNHELHSFFQEHQRVLKYLALIDKDIFEIELADGVSLFLYYNTDRFTEYELSSNTSEPIQSIIERYKTVFKEVS